ncbi:MAG TPA: sugar phosphate isomerase/epimerase [Ruminiclostridium sp.]
MKIGVSTYSYSALVNNGNMTQFDIIKKAKEMGFDLVEFAGLIIPESESAESYSTRIKEECARVEIEMGNYTIGADFINGSEGDLNAEIERLKGEVRIAKILGAPGMRHDATYGFKAEYRGTKGFQDALPILIKGCRAITEFAAELGIKTMVENHGFFCQDSERIEMLVNGVNHENFGVLLDIGNFLCADEDPAKAVGRLAPYTSHLHAKDFHTKPGTAPNPGSGWFCSRGGNFLRGSIIGHGDVPIAQCMNIIKRTGYDGNVSIEFEGMEDPLRGISVGLENLKAYMNG